MGGGVGEVTQDQGWAGTTGAMPSLPRLPLPAGTHSSLSSSSLAVCPIPGKIISFPALPPWLVNHSEKEAGQANLYSCKGTGQIVEEEEEAERGILRLVSGALAKEAGQRNGCDTCGATRTNRHKPVNQGSCPSLHRIQNFSRSMALCLRFTPQRMTSNKAHVLPR